MEQIDIDRLKIYTLEQLEKELDKVKKDLEGNEEQRVELNKQELEIIKAIEGKKKEG